MENPWQSPMDGRAAASVITKALSGVDGISCAFVFGSLATGTERSDSDVDLFVIGPIDGRRLSRATWQLSDTALGRILNWVLYTDGEMRIRIRDRNHFVLSVLAGPKLFVVGNEKSLPEYRECVPRESTQP